MGTVSMWGLRRSTAPLAGHRWGSFRYFAHPDDKPSPTSAPLPATPTPADKAPQHGQAAISVWRYVTTSQFWFESMQNWQSEFIAVAAIVGLSIFLRQRGSAESKPVAEPHRHTSA
jgi:hypothetical protein